MNRSIISLQRQVCRPPNAALTWGDASTASDGGAIGSSGAPANPSSLPDSGRVTGWAASVVLIVTARALPHHLATTRVVVVEIRPSARKHGISDDDIRHAINNAVAAITQPEQPEFSMLIGPAANAEPP